MIPRLALASMGFCMNIFRLSTTTDHLGLPAFRIFHRSSAPLINTGIDFAIGPACTMIGFAGRMTEGATYPSMPDAGSGLCE
ncbi:MAG: hypothetical protein ABW072_15740 [Sedimenticola sp.]